jgi:hypothetical protein
VSIRVYWRTETFSSLLLHHVRKLSLTYERQRRHSSLNIIELIPRWVTPRHATWPHVRQILLGSKCQHTATIYRVWWEFIEKWHHSCQECTIWSFFMVFAPRCATPCHATWPQVRQILLGSKCQHTASIYRVWWESIEKWHHSCKECTIWSFFYSVCAIMDTAAPRDLPKGRHTQIVTAS